MGTDNDYSVSLLGYNQWSEEEVGRMRLIAEKEEYRAKKKKKLKNYKKKNRYRKKK